MEGKVIVLRQVRFGKIIRQHHTGLQLGSVERQRADNAVDLTRRTPCATNGLGILPGQTEPKKEG
jgi:hypothetical protein